MFKSLTLSAIALIALPLFACSPTTAPSGASSMTASSADVSVAEVSADPPDADFIKDRLTDETKTMAQHPGLASRDGDRLVIAYDNRPVAEFNAPYMKWVFAGTIALTDPNGRKDHLAVVSINEDEIDYTAIVRRNGTLVMLDETVIASPDGRHIASGYGGSEWEANLHVVDWNGDADPVENGFSANCTPTAWHGNANFLAACVRDEDDSFTTATKVSALPGGKWHLSEMASAAMGHADEETLKHLHLRDEDSTPTDLGKNNNDIYAAKNGYRRLVTAVQ